MKQSNAENPKALRASEPKVIESGEPQHTPHESLGVINEDECGIALPSQMAAQNSQQQPSKSISILAETQAEESDSSNPSCNSECCSTIQQLENEQQTTLAAADQNNGQKVSNMDTQERQSIQPSTPQASSTGALRDDSNLSKESQATSALGSIIKTCINEKKEKRCGQSSAPTPVSSQECREKKSGIFGSEVEKEHDSWTQSSLTSDSRRSDELFDVDHPAIAFDPTTGPKGTFYECKKECKLIPVPAGSFSDTCTGREQPNSTAPLFTSEVLEDDSIPSFQKTGKHNFLICM